MTAGTSFYRCALLPTTTALHSSKFASRQQCRASFRLLSSDAQSEGRSSVEICNTLDSEQFGEPPDRIGKINGDIETKNPASAFQRYQSLLSSIGLETQVRLLNELPAQRIVTSTDVFCNREINMNGIRAIGFDMDYTLARYQQPAFDKLAFDGAKEKLVKKLGYPDEVLDFNYDHKVSGRLWSGGRDQQ
jgi:hypothetical protein